jgi:hypothetical protein
MLSILLLAKKTVMMKTEKFQDLYPLEYLALEVNPEWSPHGIEEDAFIYESLEDVAMVRYPLLGKFI